MHRTLRLLAVGVLACAGAAAMASQPGASGKLQLKPTCGEYGTSVHFEKSPTVAARKALKEEKLVLILHVSGHFEDRDFT